MREFIVTLRSGRRYTVKAERLKRDADYLAFVVAPPTSIGDLDPLEGAVALFDRREVAVVVARDHLVAEEKGEPIDPHYVADGGSDVPF